MSYVVNGAASYATCGTRPYLVQAAWQRANVRSPKIEGRLISAQWQEIQHNKNKRLVAEGDIGHSEPNSMIFSKHLYTQQYTRNSGEVLKTRQTFYTVRKSEILSASF